MTILTMSLGGSVLIAAVLLHHFLLNRLPKWTFLLLWGVVLCRLLIPFSLPSRFSVYTGAAWIAQALEQAPPRPAEEQTAAMLPPAFVPGTAWEDIRFSTAAPTIHSCPQTFHIFCGQLLAVKVNRKALFDFFQRKRTPA